MRKLMTLLFVLTFGFFNSIECLANLSEVLKLYQEKITAQKESITRSGFLGTKNKAQNQIYQQCKTIYKALQKNDLRLLDSLFKANRGQINIENIEEKWWLPYSTHNQVNKDQNELVELLIEHADKMCLRFDRSLAQEAPFNYIQRNFQNSKVSKHASYQQVFSRNQKLMGKTNHQQKEEISCKFVTQDPYVPRGANIVIRFSTEGWPEHIHMNDETMGPGGAEFVINVTEDMTFTGRVEKNGITKTCKLEVHVVDEVLNAERAFCNPDMGAGRKILVLHTNEINQTDLKTDMGFIEENTGITADIISTRQVRANDMLSDYDAIWVISDPTVQLNHEIIKLIKFYQQRGLGLAILADNEPYFATANELLRSVFPDWNVKFTGNYYGTKIINRYDDPRADIGKFFVHPVTSGLYASISEGITTSYLQDVDDDQPSILSRSEFKKVVQNSEGGLLAAGVEQLVADQTKAYPRAFYDEDRGAFVQRTFLHGAFTSMYQVHDDWGWNSQKSPGTPQFFANVACWTAGAR